MGLLLGHLIQSRECMNLKFTGELCVMTMENDAKFEEELTCQFKTDMTNLTNFDPSTQKSLKFELWWAAFDQIFEQKKVQRSYIWWHWRLMQNLKENWLVLSKMTWRIWQIFVHRLKNSVFILESKKEELNQNKNSKQPDLPVAVWKLDFTCEIDE